MKNFFNKALLFVALYFTTASLCQQNSNELFNTQRKLIETRAAECRNLIESLTAALTTCIDELKNNSEESDCIKVKAKLETFNSLCARAYQIQEKFEAQAKNYLTVQKHT